jgi:starch phosphorylase
MVREYVEDWYAPAALAAREIARDDFAGARALAGYRSRLNDAWPRVQISGVDASGLPDTPVVGAPMTVRAAVSLAGLDPQDVSVQAVVGRVSDSDELDAPMMSVMKHVGAVDGLDRFEAVVPLPHAGLTGYTVRVLPAHPLLATPAELGKVVLAG